MPKATLIKPSSFTIRGVKFVKGKTRDFPAFLLPLIQDDPRFKIVGGGSVAPAKTPEKSRAEKLLAIRAAADRLVEDEDFTSDGKPDCRALSKILGFTVTTKDRDEALAEADPEEDVPDVEDLIDDEPEEVTEEPVKAPAAKAAKALPSKEDRTKAKEKARRLIIKKAKEAEEAEDVTAATEEPTDEGPAEGEETVDDPTTNGPLEV